MNYPLWVTIGVCTLVGIGATWWMDVYAWFIGKVFKVSSLNVSMLGRWVGHGVRGKFMHRGIEQSLPIHGEAVIGRVAHYLIGIVLAWLLPVIWGTRWLVSPTLFPALIVGIATVVLPLFILQPCFGIGIAARKAAKPWVVRAKSLAAHIVYGIGLFGSAQLISWVWI